jgi:2-hydroxy-6-oxonona-2,4-dienedioate hydrolase
MSANAATGTAPSDVAADTEHASIWISLADTDFTLSHKVVGQWNTRVLEAGTGPVVVMLPGTGGHLEASSRNIGPLVRSGFRVITYDYPGHGFTTLSDHDLELPEYVDHLDQLLDVLGVDTAHLCGESLGGWIAVKYAVAHPERVGRLILNTPGGAVSLPEVMEAIRTLTQAAADDPSIDRVRTRLEWLMADPETVTDELVQLRRRIYSQPGFPESISHILCLQEMEVRLRNSIKDEELAVITAPTMVVWTSDDPSGPASAGIHMAEVLPNGRFELIEGAGHWPQWEQHATFNALVSSFLWEQ